MKVLVVDDVAAVRTRVAAMLGEVPGVEAVIQADCAARALVRLRLDAPEIVVLDLHLRGESGMTFAPVVKRERPDAILIVLTNDPSEHHRRQCIARGADYFFDKSGDFGRVVAVVSAAIARRSAAEVLRAGGDRPTGESGSR